MTCDLLGKEKDAHGQHPVPVGLFIFAYLIKLGFVVISVMLLYRESWMKP